MTLVEKLTLAGKFTIKKRKTVEKENFSNSFLGEEYNFPPDSIRFYGYDDGFSKLKEEKLPVDENLDLISNLENLKNKGLIEDYIVASAIKEEDIFIFTDRVTQDKRRLLINQKKEPIWVREKLLKILKEQNKIY